MHHVGGVGGNVTAKSMYRVGVLTDLVRNGTAATATGYGSSSNDTIATGNTSIGNTTTTTSTTTTTHAVAKLPSPLPPLLVSPVHDDDKDGPNNCWKDGGPRDDKDDHDEEQQDHLSWATLSEIDSQYTRRSTRSTTSNSIRSHHDGGDSHGGVVIVVSDDDEFEGEDDDESELEEEEDDNDDEQVLVVMPSLTGGGLPPPEDHTIDPTPRAGNLSSSSLVYVEKGDNNNNEGNDADTIPRDIPVVQFHHQPTSPQRSRSSTTSTSGILLNRSLQSGGDSTSELAPPASIHRCSSLPPTPKPPSIIVDRHDKRGATTMEQQQQQQQIEQLQQDLEEAHGQVMEARTALRLVDDELRQVHVLHAQQVEQALADQKQSLEQQHLALLAVERSHHQALTDLVDAEQQGTARRHQAALDDQEEQHHEAMQQLTFQLEEIQTAKDEAETKLKDATAKLTLLQDELEYQQESHAIALKEQEERLTNSWTIQLDAVQRTAQRKVQFAEDRNSVLEYKLSESADQLMASQQQAHKVEGQFVDTQQSLDALLPNHDALRQKHQAFQIQHLQELDVAHETFTKARHEADVAKMERVCLQSLVHDLELKQSQLQQEVEESNARSDFMVNEMRTKEDEARQIEVELEQLREERRSLQASHHQLEVDRDKKVESLQRKQMEREWVHTEQVQRLQERMERAQKSNQDCQRHLDVIYEESKTVQRRLDKVTLDFQTAKDKLLESEMRGVHLQNHVIELEDLVQTLQEDKLRLLEEHEAQTKTLSKVVLQEKSAKQAAQRKIDVLELQRVKISTLQSHKSNVQSQLIELETSHASLNNDQHSNNTQALHSTSVREASKFAREWEQSNQAHKNLRGQVHHLEEQHLLLENRVTHSDRSLEKANMQLIHKSQECIRFESKLYKLKGKLEAMRQTHSSTLLQQEVDKAAHAKTKLRHKFSEDESTNELRVAKDPAAHTDSERDQLQEKAEELLLGQEAMKQLFDKMTNKAESIDRQLAKVLQEKDAALVQLSELERRLKDAGNNHLQSIKQVESMKVVHALALDRHLLERNESSTKLVHAQKEVDEAKEELHRAKDDATALQLQADTLQDEKGHLLDLNASIENDKVSMASQWGETRKCLESALEQVAVLEDKKRALQSCVDKAHLSIQRLEQDLSQLQDDYKMETSQHALEIASKFALLETTKREAHSLELERDSLQSDIPMPAVTTDSTPIYVGDMAFQSDNDMIELKLDQANVAIDGLEDVCSTLQKEKVRSALAQVHLVRQKDDLQFKVDKQADKIKKLSKILKKAFKDPFSSSMPVITLDGTVSVPLEIDLSGEICKVNRVDGMCMHVKLQYRHRISGELREKEVDARYTGPLMDSKPHDSGMLRFHGGDLYICEFRNGVIDGSGSFIRRRRESKTGQKGGE